MKRIFVIDWILMPLLILTTYTGIELHTAGHRYSHEIGHNWAVFHLVASLLFLVVVVFHIITHRNWYKGVISRGIGTKSKVTLWLSALFALVVITGVVLLKVEGANSTIGLWHYKIGILASAFSIGHIIRRFSVLRKSLKIEVKSTLSNTRRSEF